MKTQSFKIALCLTSLVSLANPCFAEPDSAKDVTKGSAQIQEKSLTEPAAGDSAAWIRFGDDLMQKSRQKQDDRLFDRAESAYERALAIDPTQAEAMVGLAWVHNTRHEFDEGMEWARKALAAAPNLYHATSLLADAAMELGDYEQAFEHCQQAMDRSPNLATYSRAAHLLWLTGNTVKARWLMQKAIDAGSTAPENVAWCRAELALMLFNSGALLPAEQEGKSALKAAPDNYHVLYVMGRIKAAQNDFDQAVDFYRRSIDQNPTHDAVVELGDLYAFAGKDDEAKKQYERVVAMHTSGHSHSHGDDAAHSHSHSDGNAQLARFYADHDRDLDEALRQAEGAWRTYKNVYVRTTLAWCLFKNGRHAEAKEMIQKALQSHTPDAGILFRAGMIHAKLGDRTAAQKYLYQALNLNPNFHPKDAVTAAETLQMLSRPSPSASN